MHVSIEHYVHLHIERIERGYYNSIVVLKVITLSKRIENRTKYNNSNSCLNVL